MQPLKPGDVIYFENDPIMLDELVFTQVMCLSRMPDPHTFVVCGVPCGGKEEKRFLLVFEEDDFEKRHAVAFCKNRLQMRLVAVA